MGVRGLMSFVDDHRKEFFTDLKLRDTNLIIDAYSLFHWLCFNSGLELRYGGDYDSFADVAQEFFASLFACNIRPYVILDGGCDISDKKLATLKDRLRKKIELAHALSLGRAGSVCPLLLREVFLQVLIRAQVPFVQCFSEADRDITTLANHWNCPVLSSDSDFCIFDLKAGFCPLSGFQWRHVTAATGSPHRYVPAACFSADALCRHFGHPNRALLPLFAVLCGNDYVSTPDVGAVLRQLPPRVGAAAPKGRRHQRLVALLHWLSRCAGPAQALEHVVQCLPPRDREQARALLGRAVQDYEPSPAKLQDFFQHGAGVCPDAPKLGLPGWVLAALARGQLSPFISDALVLRRTILQPQVESMQRPSAHRTSQPIRQAIYALLLSADPRPQSRPSGASSPVAVSEVERNQKDIKTSVVHAVRLPKEQSDLGKLAELPSDKRELLLLETLKVKWTTLDPVPDSLRLPVAVSCYWLQHPEVQAKLLHVEALLLGMLVGPLHAMIDGPDTEDERGKGAETLYRDLCAVKARTRLSGRVDLDAAHVFCQWQSCLQMALYLNQLLSSPFPEPDLTCLYNGSLVHGLCHELLPTASAASLLSTCPEAKQLYELLFHAMQPYAPPEVFQPKSRSHSKKKRQKKQGTSRSKTRAGTASAIITFTCGKQDP
ncbi:protein asteroid homolog 1 isoform X2 [Echinops telfairi]|uniref:Protein asteroid homolog 1 isoform X2 n=2 Tax=Echinops telfairi TaxID=9371 RepID=A0AC55DPA2_ECHTE|nr:protein asteroid homolog 1 isoform X2 [Echinops telfairi]XP_045153575.1 protein asteroid homolog 1 isoform X2 [Echinops telfairi]